MLVRGALRFEERSSDQGGRWPRMGNAEWLLSLIAGRVGGHQAESVRG